MEKGNKVEIINTGDIWEGKHGTVIAEEDGQVEVRVNFETQNGTEQVIEIFNKENLKMERQDESLNEQIVDEARSKAHIILTAEVYQGDYTEPIDYEGEGETNAEALREIFKNLYYEQFGVDTFEEDYAGGWIYESSNGFDPETFKAELEEDIKERKEELQNNPEDFDLEDNETPDEIIKEIDNIDVNKAISDYFKHYDVDQNVYESNDEYKIVDLIWDTFGGGDEWWLLKIYDTVNREYLYKHKYNESLDESLNYEKPEDIIHPYVYLQDLDDKEIPAWNFASRIATAENVEEGFVLKCAEDNGYKIFSVEAPSFFRTIIAAKEVKLEDIQEEYADFLQGNAVIYEMK